MKLPNIKSLLSKKEGTKEITKVSANIQFIVGLGVTLLVIFVAVTIFSPSKEKVAEDLMASDFKVKTSMRHARVHVGVRTPIAPEFDSIQDQYQSKNAEENPLYKESSFGKRLNADQVIINSESGAFVLPPGVVLTAVLQNKIISNALELPVMARVTVPHYHENVLSIPVGSQLLGRATHDERARRVQIKFHTLVYPTGERKDFSGLALDLMDEGASGITGKYHSQKWKTITGSTLSHFLSGFAEGLKDQESSIFGAKQEGTLKNGLLEGASRSALDQANQFTSELERARGYISIPAGYPLLVFLDQALEYE